jgi:hypothetical protein
MKKSELKEMIKAEMMAEVQYDIDDTNSDYDFLAEEYEATSYDELVGPVIMGIGNIKKYVQTSAPEYLDSLIAAEDAFMAFNDKMAYGDDDLGVPGDNALGLEENRSEFDTNKPGRVGEFIKALDDLVDEYHAELYLNDELFAAMNDVKSAAKLEMGREDEMDDMPGFEGTKDSLRSLGLEEAEEIDINKILSSGGYDEVDDEELLATVKGRLKGKSNIGAKALNLLIMKIEDEEGGNIDFSENKVLEAEEEDVTDGEEEIETTDVEMTSEVDPNVKAVQDALTAAQAAAADLGDEKLTDQIGNTITFFTRQHVANIDSMNESQNRMLKLAGLLK